MPNGADADSTFLGRIGGILTGGLESAVQIGVQERINDLFGFGDEETLPVGDTDRAIQTEQGTVRVGEPVSVANPPIRADAPSSPPINPLVLLALAALVAFALVRR